MGMAVLKTRWSCRKPNFRIRRESSALAGMLVLCWLVLLVGNPSGLLATDGLAGARWQDSDDQPNIVLIISDDQRWSDYGFMGHPSIETPNLDRLARQSALFRRGYVPTALCRASLMTMITGRYASEHRTCGNDPLAVKNEPGKMRELKQKVIANIDRCEPLPRVLGQQGYLSHQSGKWWEGNFERGGFTHGMTLGLGNTPRGRHGDLGLKIGRQGLNPIEDFLDESLARKKKFFLWYAPFLPHTPHNPPDRLMARYADAEMPGPIKKYAAMCTWFDETCGELIELLEQKNLRSDTMIVYVCDNGWTSSVKGVNAPENWGAPYAPTTKRSPNDGGVRTPMMFNWPGKIKPQDREERISSLDIYPTILSAAQAPVPNDLSGLNLLPYLESGKKIPRQTLYGEAFGHDIQNIDDPEASLLNRWCIDSDWKLIVSYVDDLQGGSPNVRRAHSKSVQLFDLKNDPDERHNLAPDQPERVQRMSEKLEAWYPVKKKVINP